MSSVVVNVCAQGDALGIHDACYIWGVGATATFDHHRNLTIGQLHQAARWVKTQHRCDGMAQRQGARVVLQQQHLGGAQRDHGWAADARCHFGNQAIGQMQQPKARQVFGNQRCLLRCMVPVHHTQNLFV
jgi:hypothetical protein